PLTDRALSTLVGTPRHITAPHVFWHDDGQRYTIFANIFARIARRAEVPFRCHDLRHHFASMFLQATGDLGALQAILGHKTIAMTMRYAHMITAHLHSAMATFDAKTGTEAGTKKAVSANLNGASRV
ncbi:MAG TPA: tyrosine-type recombinase/integrase, partial [Rhodopila sp.]|nr:tyrosine-type recombinase/integrase [Rhodopila sp.]